jgi:mannose-1-phosphate guanylyltransferase/mannose-6-phosphate isomerase
MNFIVLCGGSGSRLWPKSREKYPKQFLKLTNDFSLLQNTLLRINKLCYSINKNDENIIFKTLENKLVLICNKENYFIVEEQINELYKNNLINKNLRYMIISEPVGRDSAPAICIASLLDSPETVTFIMPCDHIFDDEEFINCSIKGLEYINESIITFGIRPTCPETGYGYIEIEYKTNETKKFVEKPNKELAKQYLDSGKYLWNAGVFLFKNKNMLSCYEKYSNDIYKCCMETLDMSNKNENSINLCHRLFDKCRKISVDYAIMEYLTRDTEREINPITIPYNSSWNDIGSYLALYNEVEKNENNNYIKGNILTINTKNSYIDSEEIFTSVIGVNNLIVVNTKDSLLICNNNETQDVKEVVNYLKNKNMEEAYYHKKVFRPWGYYINIDGDNNSGSKIKRIVVYPNKRLSLQSHKYRSEHWVITKGKAKVQLDEKTIELEKDGYVYIPIKTRHRIENIGDEPLEFTETQIGNYLGEDDIERFEDDFGRI